MSCSVNVHSLPRHFDPERVNANANYLGSYYLHHEAIEDAIKCLSREELERLAIAVADELYAFKITTAVFLAQRGFMDTCKLRPFLNMAIMLHKAWETAQRMDTEEINSNINYSSD